MEQKADHREQIYRKNGDVTWARRLTTESKSIGKVGTSHGAEGRPQSRRERGRRRGAEEMDREGGREGGRGGDTEEAAEGAEKGGSRGEGAGVGGRGKVTEEAAEEVNQTSDHRGGGRGRREEGGRGRRTAYLNHKTTHRGSGTI